MATDELAADVAELTQLLSQPLRPNVKVLLEGNLKALTKQKEARDAAEARASQQAAAKSVHPQPVIPASRDLAFVPIEKFGWEQNTQFVTVLCYDIPGVGTLKSAQVTPEQIAAGLPAGPAIRCDFETDAFDLRIFGLNGKNYRLRRPNLDKDIVPGESAVKVKKNSIEVLLRKAGQWDHWVELTSKKSKDSKKAIDKDPAGGILEMMKGMYEDGDENTRKIIAEAWTKSREEQMNPAAGAAAKKKGAFGDMGGGFGGAAAGGIPGLGSMGMGAGGFGGGGFDDDLGFDV